MGFVKLNNVLSHRYLSHPDMFYNKEIIWFSSSYLLGANLQSKHLVSSGGLFTEKLGKQEKLHWGWVQSQTASVSPANGLREHKSP